MKSAAAAMILAASLSVPATAHADCGDPGQDPCTGPVPTVDQVVAIMAELTDPNRPRREQDRHRHPRISPRTKPGRLTIICTGWTRSAGCCPRPSL